MLIAIDTFAVKNEVADNMYEQSELDYLIYNAPVDYAELTLNSDLMKYLCISPLRIDRTAIRG